MENDKIWRVETLGAGVNQTAPKQCSAYPPFDLVIPKLWVILDTIFPSVALICVMS